MGYFGWGLVEKVVEYFLVAARFLEVSGGLVRERSGVDVLLSNALGRRRRVFSRAVSPGIIILLIWRRYLVFLTCCT
jgi:hypothetical protein